VCGWRVVELSRLVDECKDVKTNKTGRTNGIFEWVDESTDYSKAKKTRHIGLALTQSPSPGYKFKERTTPFW
jgi:hypothetical protein